MDLLPFLLLMPILVAAAYMDLRDMRIPNYLVLAAIAIFLVTAPLVGWEELQWRLVAAASVFLIGFVLFALNLFGGGDVKLLSAVMLFIPSQSLQVFGLVFSASLLLGILFILCLRATAVLQSSNWVSLQKPGTLPMGISIAAAGIAHPLVLAAL